MSEHECNCQQLYEERAQALAEVERLREQVAAERERSRRLREALGRSCWFVVLPSDRPVQWVGVYTLCWGRATDPTIGFGRWSEDDVAALDEGKEDSDANTQ